MSYSIPAIVMQDPDTGRNSIYEPAPIVSSQTHTREPRSLLKPINATGKTCYTIYKGKVDHVPTIGSDKVNQIYTKKPIEKPTEHLKKDELEALNSLLLLENRI